MAGMKLIEGNTHAGIAGADLSDSHNCLCKVDTDGEIVLCGDNEKPLGVIYEAAPLAGAVSVQLGSAGIAKIKAGAAIAQGARVACGASGLLKTSTGTNPIGIALDAANASGSVISVALVN